MLPLFMVACGGEEPIDPTPTQNKVIKTNITENTIQPLKNIMGSVVVYCNTGQRARYAAEQLRQVINNVIFYIPDTYTKLL